MDLEKMAKEYWKEIKKEYGITMIKPGEKMVVDSVTTSMSILHKDFSKSEIIVYGILCKYSSNKGYCYPSQQKIAEQSGLCRKQVGIAIRKLEEKNMIIVPKTIKRRII